jgi:hypothetical protein
MDFLQGMLEKPFTQLGPQQKIAAVVTIVLCLCLVIVSVAWAVRRIKKSRSSWRHRLVSPIEVSWEEQTGVKRHERGQCLDVSAGGLKMELSDSIAVRTKIYFHVIYTNLVGTASVCYCTDSESKYLIGVKFGDVSINPMRPAI